MLCLAQLGANGGLHQSRLLQIGFFNVVKKKGYRDNAVQLSVTERRRLKRAFYRWHIHHDSFGIDPASDYFEDDDAVHDASDGITDEVKARLFLLSFPPWEIEEIASLANYLFERYRKLINGKELREDFVPSFQFGDAMLQLARPDITTSDFEIKGYFLSLGPSFFPKSSASPIQLKHVVCSCIMPIITHFRAWRNYSHGPAKAFLSRRAWSRIC